MILFDGWSFYVSLLMGLIDLRRVQIQLKTAAAYGDVEVALKIEKEVLLRGYSRMSCGWLLAVSNWFEGLACLPIQLVAANYIVY